MKKIIGIDYGERYTGLAISDETQTIASKLAIVDSNPEEKIIQKVKNLMSEEAFEKIVIGLPLSFEGKVTKISSLIEKFGTKLYNELGIEVVYWNELGTSKLAEKNFDDRNIKKKRVDDEAARIILQEYLDFKINGY